MANTIKFGDGQWATKEDSILAYNDENANFKPLPFVTSRASTATRVNKDGLLETVASGVPRVDYLGNSKGSYLIEPTSRNLITQSESFANSYWTKSGATIEGDASTTGSEQIVNGDFATNSANWTGWTWTSGEMKSPNSGSFLTQTGILTSGKFYKVTFEAYADSATTLRFYLSSGDIDVPITTTKTTFTRYAESTGDFIRFVNVLGVVTYIDNVSVKEVQGFSAPSVDSNLGAFKLVESSANEAHYTRLIQTTTSGQIYSASIFAKKGERDWIGFYIDSSLTYFNLDSGTIGTTAVGVEAKIEELSNGWYRCIITRTVVDVNQNIRVFISTDGANVTYTGDGTSGVYIFGAQLEAQSYATSYIPTNGSQISRLSESASQTVPDGIIGQTEGVAYVEVDWKGNDEESTFGVLHNGTSYRMDFGYSATFNSFYFNVRNGGGQGLMQYANPTIGKYKIAIVYKNNDFALWVNGINEASDNNGTVPLTTTYNVGNYIGGGREYPIINSKLYNTRLSNSELQTLTTI